VILLVEDDEDVREMLAFTLSSRGYPVDVVSNGSAALTEIERVRPCLMILDLVMPVMTGWQVLSEMKARGYGDLPVCVISALNSPNPPEAVASLCKPFATHDMIAIAARYCTHVVVG
jgi:CheY-like chemotaxis protein